MRSTASRILLASPHRVAFGALATRLPEVTDPAARAVMVRLLAEASKWDAAAYLLEALGDRDRTVRDLASDLLRAWVDQYNRASPSRRRRNARRSSRSWTGSARRSTRPSMRSSAPSLSLEARRHGLWALGFGQLGT